MTKSEFYELLKRKIGGILSIISGAFLIAASLFLLFQLIMFLLPQDISNPVRAMIAEVFKDPRAIRDWLVAQGRRAPWFFFLAQVIQVIIAPIPGQAVALAGGFVFGFYHGFLLTMGGLLVGSFCAMLLGRLLGRRVVDVFVSEKLRSRFNNLISHGGYAAFFMIFLLPGLPDDAVCFMAGLSRLKLWPLLGVCMIGRAPGMAVLALVGANFDAGPDPVVRVLFISAMLLSIPLWLFWERLLERVKKRFLPASEQRKLRL